MRKMCYSLMMLTMLVSLAFVGCKSKKTVSAKSEIGKVLDDVPCESAGRSDKKFFRASSLATSSDLQLAKEKALLLAKQRLVTLINSNTKSVTDRYVNEREFGEASEFEQKFENLTREVADETLSNIVVTCEKASVLDDKKYRAFVAIEVSREDVLNGIERRVTRDQKLQVDYDKKKFEEIFDQEMEKMAKERGY
ncbi:hypothetical protein LX69_00209 [Breznakibacter xylanolyticus]|uniref:LPP20 lipoprotein n=1 Tax=Breznakibacter xylanolyticus TaxID=990 RepID=A0A2W7NW01_9BACT|nr:hypothetical protein [Breznakibacter xylanolyticus]PZX20784.1 hypothetical protein LX69_00209 [Breznakibacter xylanolyticus]